MPHPKSNLCWMRPTCYVPKTWLVVAGLLQSVILLASEAKDTQAHKPGPTTNLVEKAAGHEAPETGVSNQTNVVTAVSPSPALRDSWNKLSTTNISDVKESVAKASLGLLQQRLEIAKQLRISRQGDAALQSLASIMQADAPDSLKKQALLEMALAAQDENQLTKALQIFAQYLDRWPEDSIAPEILLREGLIYRQMGVNQMALTKFYAVMSTALVLKTDQFDYYRRLVLQAQTEIAETYCLQGKHQDAVEYLSRLIKADHPALNKAQVHFKLIRSLCALKRDEEVVARGRDFLEHHAKAPELPEVRFLMAGALKNMGRTDESLVQVLLLLQEQQQLAAAHPEHWHYWQQRAGNEIANQFYREGNYAQALSVYEQMACIDTSARWQVPVWYQMAISYERLDQPGKALRMYGDILNRQSEAGTNAPPHLKTVFDMARWRRNYLDWHSKSEDYLKTLKPSTVLNPTNGPPQGVEAAKT